MMRQKQTARKRVANSIVLRPFPPEQSEILREQFVNHSENQRFLQQIEQENKPSQDKVDCTGTGSGQTTKAMAPKRPSKMHKEVSEPTVVDANSVDKQTLVKNSINNSTNQVKNSVDKITFLKGLQLSSSDKCLPHNQPSTSQHVMDEETSSKRNLRKRPLSDVSQQPKIQVKKLKKKEGASIKKFIEKHGRDVVLQCLSKGGKGKEILRANKENRTRKGIQKQQASKVIESSDNNSVNPAMAPGIEKMLEAIEMMVPCDIYTTTILNKIKPKLTDSQVLELLEVDQLKEAASKKLSDKVLLDLLLERNNPTTYKKILDRANDDAIVKQIQLRNTLNISIPLLNTLLENFSKDPNLKLEDTATVKQDSLISLINNITNAVNSKPYLNNSEELLNVMLQKGPDVYSDETKKYIKNVLKRKFSGAEFNDLSYKVTKFHFSGNYTGPVIELD